MGAGCCSRSVEQNEDLLAKKDSTENSTDTAPPAKITQGYISIANRFNSTHVEKEALFGVGGLENLGKTCFVNSALQCLSNCQPLTDYFLSGVYEDEINMHNPHGTQGELTLSVAEVITTQWIESYDCIVPKNLVETIYKYGSQFDRETEQDVHEFLSFLLDKMHEDLNRVGKSPMLNGLKISGNSEELLAAKAWQDHLKGNSSVIVDLFQGQLKSTLVCQECSYLSRKFDVFMYLSLPLTKLTGMITLQECLNEFTKDENLEKGWICPQCERPVVSNKKFDIWKVPPILIIHLKRFKYIQGNFGKNKAFVDFPVVGLDLSGFVSSEQKEPPIYDLFAKIDHEGKLKAGHYYAVARNCRDNKWYKFDDEDVCETEESEIVNDKAYLLFYHKSSVGEFHRQSKNMPDLWPHIMKNLERKRRMTYDMGESAPPSVGFKKELFAVKEEMEDSQMFTRISRK
ncbi:unnamed protein product [Blepharisma stoltei]|uniref:ubiquitinyl hydrolase 1 n=1 Tax=Blepharisma stoltei TaxID=1481888 RepID=A0AAU9K0I5_9CILI|nr:unnamed protein product [Blepharisma stoltei]